MTFQGEGFVEAVSATCTSTNEAAVGDFYRVIYRYNQSSTLNDALLFIGSRSTFYVYSQSGSLNGPANTTNAYMGSHANFGYNVPGSTNLTIGSVGGLPTAQAINLKVVGTVNDFYATTGCNITFHATLVARPD